jgi:hypothetical protein
MARSGGVLFLVHFCTLLSLFSRVADVATLCIVSSNFFYIFDPSLVVELAHLRVQTRARRNTVMRHPYLSVCRLQNFSVVAALSFWHARILDPPAGWLPLTSLTFTNGS